MVTAPDIDPTNGLTLKNVFIYTAPYGTAAPTATDTLDVAWNFFGDTAADKTVDFTPPGAPTRSVVQAAREGGVTWAANYQANTDAATVSASALEVTQANLDMLLNLTRTGSYADHKGGVPSHLCVVAIGQTEDGTELGVFLPYALPEVTGALSFSVAGADAIMEIPALFSGDVDPALGFDFRIIGGADDES